MKRAATQTRVATTAPRKVNPVKKTPISESKLAISVTLAEDDDYARHRVIARKGNAEFEFEIGQDSTPYCCGMRELGGFSIERNSTALTNDEKAQAIKKLLDDIISAQTEGDRCLTSFFTLINNAACNLVARAMELENPSFTLVKSFNNRNGGRNNDVYISNN